MSWTETPQTNKDLAPVYVNGEWLLRCLMVTEQTTTMWIIERHDRAPVSQGEQDSTLFIGIMWMGNYEDYIPQLFDMATAYIDKHELSKH